MTTAIQVLIDKPIKLRIRFIFFELVLTDNFLELCTYLRTFTKFATLLNISINPNSEVPISTI